MDGLTRPLSLSLYVRAGSVPVALVATQADGQAAHHLGLQDSLSRRHVPAFAQKDYLH